MTLNPIIARRTALAAGLAGAGAVTLAACSSSSAGSSPKAPSSPKTGEAVAALDSIKVGESAAARIGGSDVLVYRSGTDTAVCFSAVCTHQGCQVAPAGAKLECPCHGSVFDAKTGKVLAGPAPSPLPQIAVKVTNGQVVTASDA